MGYYFLLGFLLATITAGTQAHGASHLIVGPKEQVREFEKWTGFFALEADVMPTETLLTGEVLKGREGLILATDPGADPRVLSQVEGEVLYSFLQRGGRAYVEYTVLPTSIFHDWNMPEAPILNRFERPAVEVEDVLGSGLPFETLLEDQNSWYLPFEAPAHARPLLGYGLWMGTYRIAHEIQEEPTSITVTVDLGSESNVRFVSQAFGGHAPNYAPDRVLLSVSRDGNDFTPAGELSWDELRDGLHAEFELESDGVRYLRLRSEKQKKSPTTDFLVVNGISALDESGENVARGARYTLQHKSDPPEEVIDGPLTSGDPPRPWRADRSHLYPAPPLMGLNERMGDALVDVSIGEGTLVYAASAFSAFRLNHFRLERDWESLMRGITLATTAPARQEELAARYAPLRVRTFPHAWAPDGSEIQLSVKTLPNADIEITHGGTSTGMKADEEGVALLPFPLPEGEHEITVRVRAGQASNQAAVAMIVSPREKKYRESLDRVMGWFLNSGVLPSRDGSEGVISTIELAALHAGEAEDLPNPFRADNQAMVGKAFYLYGDLVNDAVWKRRAVNLADFTLRYQFIDPEKASFGGFRWLLEGNDAIYPQDDNNRVSDFLVFIHERTGEERFLRAALRNAELFLDTTREDGTITYWVTDPDVLDSRGRVHFRTINPFFNVTDWCLLRLHTAWRATGDVQYMTLLQRLATIYGGLSRERSLLPRLPHSGNFSRLGTRGYALAIATLEDDSPLRAQLIGDLHADIREYLELPSVREHGVAIQTHDMNAEEISYAFNNDTPINTFAGEPLTDQLYTTSRSSVMAAQAHGTVRSETTRAQLESLLDYLVRIQFRHEDERIDGAWMRSFDVENLEYFGTRYDPNYGAYHAYTGWMNSKIATALAWYLMDASPLEPDVEVQRRGRAVLESVLEEHPSSWRGERNLLEGVALAADTQPDLGSRSLGTLTDGVIEGVWTDGLSAGWTVDPASDSWSLILRGSLPEAARVDMLALRCGGLDPARMPSRVQLSLVGDDGSRREVLDSRLSAPDGSNWFELDGVLVKDFEISLLRPVTPDSDSVYLGEIQMVQLP